MKLLRYLRIQHVWDINRYYLSTLPQGVPLTMIINVRIVYVVFDLKGNVTVFSNDLTLKDHGMPIQNGPPALA